MKTAQQIIIFLGLACALSSCAASPSKAAVNAHPGQAEFASALAAELKTSKQALSAKQIEALLAQGRYQQSIIDAMTRPAEGKPWHAYRPIFLTEKRIADGAAFYQTHRALIDSVAAQYEVPAEIVVAIIGVETSYGKITGNYKVLDALVTLGFYYPPRAPFFQGELKQLLKLGEQGVFPQPITELKGSYAGAMGWGQFIPTSYGNFAKDHDGDNRIDLWTSLPDIVASIANYFKVHGWEAGQPVTSPAVLSDTPRKFEPSGMLPEFPVQQLTEWGYSPADAVNPDKPANLLLLEGANGQEPWIIYKNFYVISRYNRSPLYSMAVYQLSQEIAKRTKLETAP